MFKFNFELDDSDIEETNTLKDVYQEAAASSSSNENDAVGLNPFIEHSLDDLISQLPPEISYSPLIIASGEDVGNITISRRDLFDARFQLIASGSSDNPAGTDSASLTDLEYVEAPSDLVPGVYEGGLKTWECSIDLAAELHNHLSWKFAKSQRILEIGCGTAVPSLCILHKLFSAPPITGRRTAIHLQDYNELVFRLVTLPNAILAWYMSPASEPFRRSYEAESAPTSNSESTPAEQLSADSSADHPAEDDAEDTDPLPPPDPTQPGDLPLPPSLLAAFQASLRDYGIDLRFFSGSWETFDVHAAASSYNADSAAYDVVVTSETIYRTESLPALLDLMWRAQCARDGESLESATRSKLNIEPPASQMARGHSSDDSEDDDGYLCLVAAKQVYFGVGGGVREFIQAVESGLPTNEARHKGTVKKVWSLDEGVKRSVMRVFWE